MLGGLSKLLFLVASFEIRCSKRSLTSTHGKLEHETNGKPHRSSSPPAKQLGTLDRGRGFEGLRRFLLLGSQVAEPKVANGWLREGLDASVLLNIARSLEGTLEVFPFF